MPWEPTSILYQWALRLIGRWGGAMLRDLYRLAGDDVPSLSGHWIVTFRDPQGNRSVRVAIEATLNQRGRRVAGLAHLLGKPNDVFTFEGTVKRNVFLGTYARVDSHVLAGTGNFLLKVNANSRKMRGHCMWYDAGLDDVWVSRYRWEKRDGLI